MRIPTALMRIPTALTVLATSVAIAFAPIAMIGIVTVRGMLLLAVVVLVVISAHFIDGRPRKPKRKHYPSLMGFKHSSTKRNWT